MKMMEVHLLFLTLSFVESAYISRMATVNRMRSPTPFRPGVMMRPWGTQRLMPAASNMMPHRTPFIYYRNSPKRYAVKHFPSGTRTLYGNSPWKSTGRLPTMSAVTPEYEFIRAASAPPVINTDGAIHTIPAPNLSLSEKPIVVVDSGSSDNIAGHNVASESPKPVYEVTEKYPEPIYQMAKIETPVAFSKVNHLTTPELQSLVRNGAALQFSPDYGLQPINLPHSSVLPQQYAVQRIPSQEDLMINPGAEGIVIPPNALYQPDPMFLQKLQSHLVQRYPAVEFIPYTAEVPQGPVAPQTQPATQQIFLFDSEQITKQVPSAFQIQPSESKNIVQRATQESSAVTLVPQNIYVSNVTEFTEDTTQSQPNITVELETAEYQPVTTTIKYVVESNTEEQHNTTPIYYAQIGQSVGNVIANGFYSAINDVRAAAALAQIDKPQEASMNQIESENSKKENVTSTTLNPDLKSYFVQNQEKDEKNLTVKPLLGVPFAKPDSVKVAYTLLRTEDKQPKVTQEGNVYAGQIVQATISEDQDYNKEKATLLSNRPPIRIFAVPEKQDLMPAASSVIPRIAVVKAKIPPKSKLTFDDKTGEPVLRIYASYDENPTQKEAITTKLGNLRFIKDAVARRETVDNWKSSAVKSVQKTQGFDANQVSQFGLKLRSRSDDYIPLFDEYDD